MTELPARTGIAATQKQKTENGLCRHDPLRHKGALDAVQPAGRVQRRAAGEASRRDGGTDRVRECEGRSDALSYTVCPTVHAGLRPARVVLAAAPSDARTVSSEEWPKQHRVTRCDRRR